MRVNQTNGNGRPIAAIGFILIHLAVSLVHGRAHDRLGIGLNTAQKIFIGVVIVAMPLVAGLLLWKNRIRTGGTILTASMLGALIFGVFYHFVAPGADNVNHQIMMGSATWGHLFDQTAIAIAVLEILGTILGLTFVLKSYKTR